MKLLLDTHTFLWHADGDSRMIPPATALLIDPANEDALDRILRCRNPKKKRRGGLVDDPASEWAIQGSNL